MIPCQALKTQGSSDTYPANATPDCTNYNTSTYTCSGGSESAYATIADVNAGSFSGDDQILFRKGQTWREQLTVPSSGTSGHPITFGAFGSGNKPIISGADIITGWTNYSGSVWQATVTTQPSAVWFDGTYGIAETAIGNIDAQYEWYWASNVLYIYSTSDPDTAFTSPGIEVPSITNGIIKSTSKDYVVIDSLIIEKGDGATPNGMINIASSNYVTVENSEVRKSASIVYGIAFDQSTHATVNNNLVHDTLNSAIYFRRDSTYPVVSYNEVYNIGLIDNEGDNAALMFGGGSAGWQGIDNAIVEHNYIST